MDHFTNETLREYYHYGDLDEGKAMLANLHIMSGCQLFIGAQTSNVARIVYEIMSLSWEIVPYVDVNNWGFHVGAVPRDDSRPPPLRG